MDKWKWTTNLHYTQIEEYANEMSAENKEAGNNAPAIAIDILNVEHTIPPPTPLLN